MKKASKRGNERYDTRGIRVNYTESDNSLLGGDVSDSDEPLIRINKTVNTNESPNSNHVDLLPVVNDLDDYCFKCHKVVQKLEDRLLCPSEKCGRSFHRSCARSVGNSTVKWICSHCQDIAKYENKQFGLNNPEQLRLSKLSRKELNEMLGLAVDKLKKDTSMDPFFGPVDPRMYPTYYHVVVHPMSLLKIGQKVQQEEYTSVAEFRSDVSWILHNCIVFNSNEHPLSANAKKLVFNAKQETLEMEACPECYRSAVLGKENWFTDVCHPPHALVWAKLAGYPYWPAKVLNCSNETVDQSSQLRVQVHFFADHNKQKLSPTEVYFLSEQPPPESSKNRGRLNDAIVELNAHIDNIKSRFGCFYYYPPGLMFSLQPMLQMWLINPPSEESIANARSLSSQPLSIQGAAVASKNGKIAEKTASENNDAESIEPAESIERTQSSSSSSDTTSETGLPEASETRAEKRNKMRAVLVAKFDDAFRRFVRPLFGVIPEKLPKCNLLDHVDLQVNISDKPITSEKSVPNRAMPDNSQKDDQQTQLQETTHADSSATIVPDEQPKAPVVHFEEAFMKAIEAFNKKQQLQLSLSLRTAFAMFREEASHDLSDECLTSFLKACDALQVKCEQNVASTFQQAAAGCVQKCAMVAQGIVPQNGEVKSTGNVQQESVEDTATASRLVDYERAEFLQTLVQAMVADTERQVNDAKSKHWCTNCKLEATLHCCRYASYCSYECQTKHWSQHRQICCQVASQRIASQPAQSQ